MNTSQTHLLSAEQLEGFLENKLSSEEMKRVQHLLDDCELSREALQGYTLVPGAFADLGDIKSDIASKAGIRKGINGKSIVFAASFVCVGVFFMYWFLSDTKEYVKASDAPTVMQSSVSAPQTNPLSPVEDHFVNPDAKVVAITMPKPIREKGDTQSVMTIETNVIVPVPIEVKTAPILEQKPIVPAKPEASYNAQVGFIFDLKITDFDKYYATSIEVREPKLSGTPAQFENQDGAIDADKNSDGEVVRAVPAEQFLQEGLLAFRDGRFGKCVSKMDVLLKNNPDDVNALFYTAVSYVKLELYSKAIPLLDKIIEDQNNVFDEEAEWYKALALEGNGDEALAQALFQKISSEGGFYATQASKKLK